jgi:hypothetical protein
MLPNQSNVTPHPPVTLVTLVTFVLKQPQGRWSKSAKHSILEQWRQEEAQWEHNVTPSQNVYFCKLACVATLLLKCNHCN